MNILFYIVAFLLIYPLFIYPLCLMLLKKFKNRKVLNYDKADELPSVSILLSAFNEESVIAQKIENFLALDYPKEKLEFLIISDESMDSTDSIVNSYIKKENIEHERIRLLRQEPRQGKTKALNRAALEAKGDIFFFTDADSMLHTNAMKKLIAPFKDQAIGLVSGRSVYKDESGSETTGSIYRQYEEWIKEYEGILYGIAGADGGIYAMRKELYKELPQKIINDLAHPIHVVLENKKALAVPTALVSEPPEDDSNAFARQTRIMTQSWYVFFTHFMPLLQKRRFGFLWQFFSHKILRWLTLPLIALFIICAIFASGILPKLGLICALIMLIFAFLGEKAKIIGRICRLFILQAAAAIYGLFKLCQGEVFITWNPKG